MSFFSASSLFCIVWVSILLTTLDPSTAFAQKSCGDVFSEPRRFVMNSWAGALQESTGYDPFASVLASLERSLGHLSRSETVSLQQVDLTEVIRKFNSSDQKRLIERVQAAKVKGRYDQQISPIDNLLLPLEIYLDPADSVSVLKDLRRLSDAGVVINEAFAGARGLRAFNQTMISALEQLPSPQREEFRASIKSQLEQVSPVQETVAVLSGTLKVSAAKTHRRNLEILLALVDRREVESLSLQLRTVRSRDELIRVMNAYFHHINQALGNGRGGYGFEKVLDAAETLRKELGGSFSEADHYVELYGSFVNGKAAFETSDIDMKISAGLLAKITHRSKIQIEKEPFSLFFADVVKRERPENTEMKEFWKGYQKAEKALAQNILNRSTVKASEVLTVVYPPREHTEDATDFRWYNPIVVRINKDQIVVQIVKVGETIETTEVRVPSAFL